MKQVHAYPSAPWDPPEIIDLRTKLQKPYDKENCEAFYIHRRISIYLTLLLHRVGWVYPDMVTKSGAFLAVFFAFVLSFLSNDCSVVALIGILAYHTVYMLDLIDGELARLKSKFSPHAKWLDRMQDFSLLSLVIAVVIKALVSCNMLTLSVLVAVTLVFRFGVSETALAYGRPVNAGRLISFGKFAGNELTVCLLRYPFTWPGLLLILFVGCTVGSCKLLALLLWPWLAVYALHGLYKLYMMPQQR